MCSFGVNWKKNPNIYVSIRVEQLQKHICTLTISKTTMAQVAGVFSDGIHEHARRMLCFKYISIIRGHEMFLW